MSIERRKRQKPVDAIREQTGFETVRVVGYVASCVNHGLSDVRFQGARQMQPYHETDQYLLPRVCRTQQEYDDALAHAERVAQQAHAKTKCKHKLVVTLNVS